MPTYKATLTVQTRHLERIRLGPFTRGRHPNIRIRYEGVDPPHSTVVESVRVDLDADTYNLVYMFQNFGNKTVTATIKASSGGKHPALYG